MPLPSFFICHHHTTRYFEAINHMSTHTVIVGGTVAIDNVITPVEKRENLLGGSAAYAAIATTLFNRNVELVGVVGDDFPQEHTDLLASKGIGLEGLETSTQKTFTWSGKYLDNMNDRETLDVAINVLENWEVKVPSELQKASIVVLANMAPANQLQMLSQSLVEKRYVIADTMDLWIDIAKAELEEVLTKIDLLVLNDSEAKQFTGAYSSAKAGHLLLEKGLKSVIIKHGEFGATLFHTQGNGSVQLFKCPAWPLQELVDPTGAGDSFLGGLAGTLAAMGKTYPTLTDLKQGIINGTIAASFTCESFSTEKLQEITPEQIKERRSEFWGMSHWDA